MVAARWPIAVAAAIALAPAAFADSWLLEYPRVATEASAACHGGKLEDCRAGLLRLGELTDGRPDFRCRLARVEAELGLQAAALADLSVCLRSGLAFAKLPTEPSLESLRDLKGFKTLEAEAGRFEAPALEYQPRYALADPGLIAEDIAYDPADRSFYLSSVHDRKIIRRAADGMISDFVTASDTPLWGVYAIAVDSTRGVLWATTSAGAESPPYDATDEGKSAVLKFDLKSRALLGRYALADGRKHGFGDVTLGENGSLIVSDGIDGGVYAVGPGPASGLGTVVAPGSLRSPQTPAVIPGTGRVLIPDYSRGIAVADVGGGAIAWLPHPAELALFGIDGLYLRGRTLVAVQNGTVPERILVMTLDPSCSRISAWHTAIARAPGLGDPTHATFVGDELLVLVNSGWDRVSDAGILTDLPGAKPAEIWQLRWTGAAAERRATCPRS